MDLKNLFKGQKILEEADSPVNGKITVVKSLGLGTYFQVGNLTQSGGVVYSIWKSTLDKIKPLVSDPGNILILGLGGGSCANLSRKLWPYAHIVGVDFDKTIVDLGKKYLGLNDVNAEIMVRDANEFVVTAIKEKKEFNFIVVDLYVGQEFPIIFESDTFLNNIKKILTPHGIVVFNKLYFGEKRSEAMRFGEKLDRVFTKVEYYYPEANVMLICVR